jgi:hypothetical protein
MPEYGRWMLEATPRKPFEGLTALLKVEDHMRLRRSRLLSVMNKGRDGYNNFERDGERYVRCLPLNARNNIIGDFYYFDQILFIKFNIQLNIIDIQLNPSGEVVPTLAVFPLMGVGDFWDLPNDPGLAATTIPKQLSLPPAPGNAANELY